MLIEGWDRSSLFAITSFGNSVICTLSPGELKRTRLPCRLVQGKVGDIAIIRFLLGSAIRIESMEERRFEEVSCVLVCASCLACNIHWRLRGWVN